MLARQPAEHCDMRRTLRATRDELNTRHHQATIAAMAYCDRPTDGPMDRTDEPSHGRSARMESWLACLLACMHPPTHGRPDPPCKLARIDGCADAKRKSQPGPHTQWMLVVAAAAAAAAAASVAVSSWVSIKYEYNAWVGGSDGRRAIKASVIPSCFSWPSLGLTDRRTGWLAGWMVRRAGHHNHSNLRTRSVTHM